MSFQIINFKKVFLKYCGFYQARDIMRPMRDYLQLVCYGLLIGALCLYVGGSAVFKSFDVFKLKTSDTVQSEEELSATQKMLMRQKWLMNKREDMYKTDLRQQQQRIKDNMRMLKDRMNRR